MKKNKLTFKIMFILAVTIALWASAFVGIRAALHGYSPGGLALLRYGIASICMFFIYKRFGAGDVIALKDKLLLMIIGVIGIGWYNLTVNYGEVTVSSATSSFIISQGPIISTILAIAFLGEKASVLSFSGMIVSIFGVLLISIGESGGMKLAPGISYLLTATFLGGVYSIMQKPFLKKYHAIDVTAYIIWGCTFSMLVYLPEVSHDIVKASLSSTLWVIYLGIFPAAIAYAGWSYVLSEIPASRAVSFLYIIPILTAILGWLFLNEIPAIISMIGGMIAMAGVWTVNKAYGRVPEKAIVEM